MIVENLAVESDQWISFLCCYVVCEMEKTIFSLLHLKYILNSIKNVHVPKKPQRVISATRGWEYFAKDCLWTVFSRVWQAEVFLWLEVELVKAILLLSASFSLDELGWLHFLDLSFSAIFVYVWLYFSSLCLANLCFSERKWL